MFLTVEWRRLKVVVSAAGQIEICDTRGTSGTESVKFMAFYDVKNARLMERRPTETVVQREAEFGWRDKAVHLNSGMANSKTYEKAILCNCWKGSPICGGISPPEASPIWLPFPFGLIGRCRPIRSCMSGWR